MRIKHPTSTSSSSSSAAAATFFVLMATGTMTGGRGGGGGGGAYASSLMAPLSHHHHRSVTTRTARCCGRDRWWCRNTNEESSSSLLDLDSSSILIIREIRGGGEGVGGGPSSSPPRTPYGYEEQEMDGDPNNFQSPPPPTTTTTASKNADGYNNMDGMGVGLTSTGNYDPMYNEYKETVEDRIDAWRKQQQQMRQTQTAEEAASVVDEQGKFKLFTTVSRASVSLFFFILMWRTVHHYELADATFGNRKKMPLRAAALRTFVVTPLVVLFLGEMMGAVLGLAGGRGIGGVSSESRATKKRLKGILNLHKGVELAMMSYNVLRLAVWPSRYVTREIYIGRIISNFFFLMQAQLYTKLNWDEVGKSAIGEGGYATESYYDDYVPEARGNQFGHDSFSQSSAPTGDDGYYARNSPLPQQQQQQQQQQWQQNQSQYEQNFAENSTGWSQ